MRNIGKDDHPKLWSLIFVLIIALTFCCFAMGQGLNSGTSVFLAGQGYGASLAGVLALVFSIAAALARLFIGPVIDNGKCSLRYHRRHRYPHSRNSTVRCRSRHPPLHN